MWREVLPGRTSGKYVYFLSTLITVYRVDLKEADTIIMGSDGLFNNVFDHEIVSIISRCKDVLEAAKTLADLASSYSKDYNFDSPYSLEARSRVIGYLCMGPTSAEPIPGHEHQRGPKRGSIPGFAGVLEMLSVTLVRLKSLEVEIDLNSMEILPILCVLRSSPNLKELKIRYGVDAEECRIDLLEEGAKFWAELTQFDCLLNHLRAVEIIGLGMLLDLEFINAPILEKMIIYTNEFVEAEEVSRFLAELLQFQ